jgi:hypothetical protein
MRVKMIKTSGGAVRDPRLMLLCYLDLFGPSTAERISKIMIDRGSALPVARQIISNFGNLQG